jgi:hypothetical protein
MTPSGIPIHRLLPKDELLWSARRVVAHSSSLFESRVVIPLIAAIFFFALFTAVYIMMRRPSFGEGRAAIVPVVALREIIGEEIAGKSQ